MYLSLISLSLIILFINVQNENIYTYIKVQQVKESSRGKLNSHIKTALQNEKIKQLRIENLYITIHHVILREKQKQKQTNKQRKQNLVVLFCFCFFPLPFPFSLINYLDIK